MIDNNIISIFFASLIQGFTEFLPISSSGHLVLFNYFFSQPKDSLDFEIILHFGTILSIIVYYKNDIFEIIFNVSNKKDFRYVSYLIIGCIPISIVGFIFKDSIEQNFNNISILPISFLISFVMIFLTKFKYPKRDFTFKIIAVMSIFHILALLPGISRSGMTISSLIILGIPFKESVKLSFLMAIPLIMGATFLSIDFSNFNYLLIKHSLLGIIFSFLAGLFAIYLTNYFLINKKYWLFSIYCFLMAILTYFINQ